MTDNMTTITTNVCIRCGKQRIVVKTYQELVGNHMITYTETSCPDTACQKKLVKQLDQEKIKRHDAMQTNHSFRMNRKVAS